MDEINDDKSNEGSKFVEQPIGAHVMKNVNCPEAGLAKSMFEAYHVLYFPVFSTYGDIEYVGNVVGDDDMRYAMTFARIVEKAGNYLLDAESVLHIATCHANDVNGMMDSIDPFETLKKFCPDFSAVPFYPDFPSQVLDMDEAQFRFHQMMHYASTYGVESVMFDVFGIDVQVSEGWLPDVVDTPKVKSDVGVADAVRGAQVLSVVLCEEKASEHVLKSLEKLSRMSDDETDCAIALEGTPGFEAALGGKQLNIRFKENMLGLVEKAVGFSSAKLASVLANVCSHPGDVLKCVPIALSSASHLPTRVKKSFVKVLLSFPVSALENNLADGGKEAKRAVSYLSFSRFSRSGEHNEVVRKCLNGELRSWNSFVEEKWREIKEGKPVAGDLLSLYCQRPGVFLRTVVRMLKAGIGKNDIRYALMTVSKDLSPVTLVRVLTSFSAVSTGFEDCSSKEGVDQCLLAEGYDIVYMAAANRFSSLDTPLKGKKVFFDAGVFSAKGSLALPNATGVMGSYPPVGIAYNVPEDKTVRFFTYWNDNKERVDIDLHFIAKSSICGTFHVGWNSYYKKDGLIMSGDVTTSHNSVEYLDLDLKKAKECGIELVKQHCHIYSGRYNWAEIESCFSGCMLAHNLMNDVKLYDPDNVIFRDDLDGRGYRMDYALINVPDHWVRIIRGSNDAMISGGFTVDQFLELLFTMQECVAVDDPKDADVVLSLGRSETAHYCLIDENFFLD